MIAEDGALSAYLMAEDIAAEISRVLRPGGQLLACVDSLVLGMSILAEQHHWAELTDLPQAEVVLIPWPDGRITRCFGPEQLTDLLTEAGLEVSWIRPRTVLSPSMVDHVLRREPGAITRLVRAEMAAGRAGRAHGRRQWVVRHVPAGRGAQARLNRVSDICRLHMSDTAGWSQRRRWSRLDWQFTQRDASGRASSRPSGIGRPQSAHVP